MKLEEILSRYREKSEKEFEGPPPRPKSKVFCIDKCLSVQRPYFQALNPDDKFYVESFRMARYALVTVLGLKGAASMYYRSGYELGKRFVELGFIKSVDDLFNRFHESRLGLITVVKDTENKKIVDVYECISGSGLPNIGMPVCHFEAGILAGIFTKLTQKQHHAVETHCWATGYTACRIKIYPI